MTMAMAFSESVMVIRTMPAAAALRWNSGLGSDTQLNIWIGIAVNAESSHCMLKNGGVDWSGELGSVPTYVTAQNVIKGAVSPIVRDMAMIVPVAIPPAE